MSRSSWTIALPIAPCRGPELGASRHTPFVLVDESAEDVATMDDARPGCWPGACVRIGREKLEGPMWPRPVVVLSVGVQDALQMMVAEDQHVVQALLPDRADPVLRERVRLRRPNLCLHHGDPLRSEDLVEGA